MTESPLTTSGTSRRLRYWLFFALWNVAVVIAIFATLELACAGYERLGGDAEMAKWSPYLRSPNFLPPKQPGEIRLFFYGGSTVFGGHIPVLGFVKQMDRCFSKIYPGKIVRVMNFARSGKPTAFVLSELMNSIDFSPDIVVVSTGHNEFIGKTTSSADWRLIRYYEQQARRFALTRVLGLIISKIYWNWSEASLPERLTGWQSDSEAFRERAEIFTRDLSLISSVTRKAGAQLVFLTAPSNILDWPPAFRRFGDPVEGYEQEVKNILRLTKTGSYEEALARATALHEKLPDDSMALYLLGRAKYFLGDISEAKKLLITARDGEPYPCRAPSVFNDNVRGFTGTTNTTVIDTEKELEEHSENGVIGEKLIPDNVHPAPETEWIIARRVMSELVARKLLPEPAENVDDVCSVDKNPDYIDLKKPHSERRLRYLLQIARYSIKTNSMNFEGAREIVEGLAVDYPESWEVWALLATLEFLDGNGESGLVLLEKAKVLLGHPIDRGDRSTVPRLREAMERYEDATGRKRAGDVQ